MDDPSAQKSLEYEETPLIEPIAEAPKTPPLTPAPPTPQAPPPPKKPSFFKKFFGFIGNLIFFATLFVLGMWLSTILRQFLPTGIEQEPVTEQEVIEIPTPTPKDPTALWTLYTIGGLSYKL